MRASFSFKILIVILFLGFKTQAQKRIIVSTIKEYNITIPNLNPGDTIVLANGIWENVELLFEGKGTAQSPITLTVEDKGMVTLEGQSYLQIAGEFLHVEGLVFKNGYTPKEFYTEQSSLV